MIERIFYGNMPVPYAVIWSEEDNAGQFVGKCEHTGLQATCNIEKRGAGKPRFATPHMNRQREVIAKDWCDLCARPLKGRTKVSLSHARMILTDEGPSVIQVEPMLHKDCALMCVDLCPHLKRDVKAGTLYVRQVLKHRPILAKLTTAAVMEFCGVERQGDVVGHAKVELQRWKERDLNWLTST